MPEVAGLLSLTLRTVLQVPSPRSYQKQPRLGAGSKCPNELVKVSAIPMQTGADSLALQRWQEGRHVPGNPAPREWNHSYRSPSPWAAGTISTTAPCLRPMSIDPQDCQISDIGYSWVILGSRQGAGRATEAQRRSNGPLITRRVPSRGSTQLGVEACLS